VPLSTVTLEVQQKTLAAVTIDDAELHRPIAAIHKKSKVLSLAMKHFLAMLRQTE